MMMINKETLAWVMYKMIREEAEKDGSDLALQMADYLGLQVRKFWGECPELVRISWGDYDDPKMV